MILIPGQQAIPYRLDDLSGHLSWRIWPHRQSSLYRRPLWNVFLSVYDFRLKILPSVGCIIPEFLLNWIVEVIFHCCHQLPKFSSIHWPLAVVVISRQKTYANHTMALLWRFYAALKLIRFDFFLFTKWPQTKKNGDEQSLWNGHV